MRICLVTDELFPADRGGIARLLHNLAHQAASLPQPPDLWFLLPTAPPARQAMLRAAFDGVAQLEFAQPDAQIAPRLGLPHLRAQGAAQGAAPLAEGLIQGLRVLDTIRQAEALAGGPFDLIEVPDHGGLGAVLIAARDSGQALAGPGTGLGARIVCRLHSAFSIIAAHEPFAHDRGAWAAVRLDAERATIAGADLVIAHLDSIARANADHFGLGPDWLARVQVEFPPVVWPVPTPTIPAAPDPQTDFVFAARFQPFKRPELFIRAAARFIALYPECANRFRLIAYGHDPAHIDLLRLMIPPAMRARIRLEVSVPEDQRAQAIATGILVQPSNYESLCALAYEAAAIGRPVLLARDCAAFGPGTRWRDGENCLIFDPTPEGLAYTMRRALDWQPRSMVECTPDLPWFVRADTLVATAPGAADLPGEGKPLVLLVLRDPVQAELLPGIAAELGADTPLCALLRAPNQMPDQTPDQFPGLTLVPPGQFLGQAVLEQAARWSGPVVLCSPDALPEPAFLALAAKALRSAATGRGRVLSANARGPDGALVAHAGQSGHLAAAGLAACPPCLALHGPDLSALVDPLDDREILARAVARLPGAPLRLTLAPLPLVQLASNPPARDRRMAGWGAIGGQPPLRVLGLDLPGAQPGQILAATPIRIGPDPDLTLHLDGTTQALPLPLPATRQSLIVTLHASLPASQTGTTPDAETASQEAAVSVHQMPEADSRAAHDAGTARRSLMAGGGYVMRWGPFAGRHPLVLVVSGSAGARLHLSRLRMLTAESPESKH